MMHDFFNFSSSINLFKTDSLKMTKKVRIINKRSLFLKQMAGLIRLKWGMTLRYEWVGENLPEK